MSDLELDLTTHDVTLTSGDLTIIPLTLDAIKQHLDIQLGFFQAEWFLDERVGIPYFGTILVKNPNIIVVNSIFRRTILGTPGVIEITSYDLDLDTGIRKATLTFEADTVAGPLEFSKDFIL